jgi:L-ascorbate metabolism protein UlaG (beta-lactamase superfamily)
MSAARTAAGTASLTFLGHASFRIETGDGRVVLIDPWFTGNPVLPAEWKTIDRADLVLVTHGHGDHLDPNLPDLLRRTGATLAAPPELLHYVRGQMPDHELPTLGLNIGGSVDWGGTTVTMTPAFHNSYVRAADGSLIIPHNPVGFLVRLPNRTTLYAAGDTSIFSDMALLRALYRPTIALLPIGDAMTMGPVPAALATEMLGVTKVVPFHYGTFPFLTGTAEEFETALAAHGLEKAMRALKPGESLPLSG